MSELPVVVLDNGTGYLKAGLSNETEPSVLIPSLIGRPLLRYGETLEGVELKSLMLGDEVIPVRSMLELSYPITEGIITNPEDMGLLLDYAITKKIGIPKGELKERKALITEAPLNPLNNKKIMAEILFDKMGFGYMNIEPQAKLTLMCEGLESGLVLDSGDGVTHCIPIYSGMLMHNNIKRLNIAGRHITQKMIKLLQLKGYAFNSSSDFELIKGIKEKYCFVSCDFERDIKLNMETTFYNQNILLPDGRKIMISNERFEAPEILFNPRLNGMESLGIPQMVFNCIQECDISTRLELFKYTILSGASTMYPGFASRFSKEMKALYKKNILQDSGESIKIDMNTMDNPRRKFSVFIGASLLSNIYNDNRYIDYWISKEEWDEQGADRLDVIRNKCKNIFQ